jgi:ketosteroid isomerase-like protein
MKREDRMMRPSEIVMQFVEAVNDQHIDKMVGLMTPDHRFVDSLGKEIPGRRAMRDAWLGFFDIVPDYTITVEETLEHAQTVVILGKAGGTYSKDGDLPPQNCWQVPAAWKAVVDGARITEWRAFVDNEPLRRLMGFLPAPDRD